MLSVLLSHSHADKDFVRLLGQKLESNGIHTWVDEAEINVGDSLISKIQQAIEDCTYVAVVLSPDSVSSEWVRKEVEVALTQEIAGRRVKVLPLLYRHCAIPPFLAGKVYADFTISFDSGFARLLARLNEDLHDQKHHAKSTREKLHAGYQDWLVFGKTNSALLSEDILAFVISHVEPTSLSPPVLAYVLCSIAILCRNTVGSAALRFWSAWCREASSYEAFEEVMQASDHKIRAAATILSRMCGMKYLVPSLSKALIGEDNTDVKRRILQALVSLQGELSSDLMTRLITDTDWVTRILASRIAGVEVAIVISDETEYSSELTGILEKFVEPVCTIPALSLSQRDSEFLEYGVLGNARIVVLVRGDHYNSIGSEKLYSAVYKYVKNGGRLLATSWAAWENKDHNLLDEVLPFDRINDGFREDVAVICRRTSHPAAASLFPTLLRLRTSLEFLSPAEGSEVLCETTSGIPMFGFKKFALGVCFYLNSCQHSCSGYMPSPLDTNREFSACLHRLLPWILNDQWHAFSASP